MKKNSQIFIARWWYIIAGKVFEKEKQKIKIFFVHFVKYTPVQ